MAFSKIKNPPRYWKVSLISCFCRKHVTNARDFNSTSRAQPSVSTRNPTNVSHDDES